MLIHEALHIHEKRQYFEINALQKWEEEEDEEVIMEEVQTELNLKGTWAFFGGWPCAA